MLRATIFYNWIVTLQVLWRFLSLHIAKAKKKKKNTILKQYKNILSHIAKRSAAAIKLTLSLPLMSPLNLLVDSERETRAGTR